MTIVFNAKVEIYLESGKVIKDTLEIESTDIISALSKLSNDLWTTFNLTLEDDCKRFFKVTSIEERL